MEVGFQQIHTVSLEAGVGSCFAVVDEAQAGSARRPWIDGLKRVARSAVVHIDHRPRLEISIDRHIAVSLLLLSIRIIDLSLQRQHLLPVLIPSHLLAVLLV